MSVKAKAETGIVISNAYDGVYRETAASTKVDVAQLYPGSTSNLNDFYHSTSSDTTRANTGAAYTSGSAWANNTDCGNYVVHDFWIHASGAEDITVNSLNVKSLVVTFTTTTFNAETSEYETSEATTASNELSKSLRVGVRFGNYSASGNYFIYAPVTGATKTYDVYGGSSGTSVSSSTFLTDMPTATNPTPDDSIASIPNNTVTDNSIHAYVYIWFEGEDAACISQNIVSNLEQLSIEIAFSISD